MWTKLFVAGGLLLRLWQASILAVEATAGASDDPVVCDCGFRDENNHVWSEIWYADYSTYKVNVHKDVHYVVMDYTVNAKYNNTLNRVFDPTNVQVDENGQVQLAVRKLNDNEYTSASFGTRRQDILYGTFRVSMKTSSVPGTVAAFYFYRDDTCEIDIESLSRIQNPWKTFFSVQPQIYNPDGSASTLTNDKHDLPFDPTSVSFLDIVLLFYLSQVTLIFYFYFRNITSTDSTGCPVKSIIILMVSMPTASTRVYRNRQVA